MLQPHITTSDGIYAHLKEQILHLELPPGTLISEIGTSEKYNISRTPIRDAFKRLERDGLINIRPHIGTFVSRIDLNTVSDILYIREVLEYAVLSDLAQTYNESMDSKIRPILKEQKKLLNSDMSIEELSRAFILSDNEFHTALFDASGKKNVFEFICTYNSQYERLRTLINYNGKADLQKLYECHKQIVEYIDAKDLIHLKDCIHHHLYDGLNASDKIICKYPDYFTQFSR